MSSSPDDVIIKCSDAKEIRVTRSKLIGNCPKLIPNIVSTSTPIKHILEMPYPFEIVAEFVIFVEIGDPILTTIQEAFQLYQLSLTYEMEIMKKKCQSFLTKEIKYRPCKIYEFACQVKDQHLRYLCWKTFDSSFKEIFLSDDFLNCNETTIMTYLSRPIYESLTELELFLSIYKWCKMKNLHRIQQLSEANAKSSSMQLKEEEGIRNIMDNYLPFIRLLLLTVPELEQNVFNLNLLTPEEKKGILHYKRTENDTSRLPGTICKTTSMRIIDIYDTLFHYLNRHDFHFTYDRLIKDYHEFFCEIVVDEACFLIEIEMPISNVMNEAITVNLEGLNVTHNEMLEEIALSCNSEGKIELSEPMFLEKKNQYKFNVKISNRETKIFKHFYVKKDAHCFISDDDFRRMNKRKCPRARKNWYHFHFNVTLYF